ATACTSKDSLIDDGASGMGTQSPGGTSGKGGGSGAQAGAGAKAGSSASGGSSAGAGAAGQGGSSQGGSGGSGASAGSDAGSGSGGAAAGAGGAAMGGGSGGDGGSSGAADGGSSGNPGAGTGGGGGASGPCSEVTVLADCEARTDCHSVYQDPGTCGCASVGCCAKFSRCVDGDKADCEGKGLSCEALTPLCDDPAFVVSYSGSCYEGCVKPKDCEGAASCTLPAQDGCSCFGNEDCPVGANCYGADCASNTPGVCHVPPPSGCFGDFDCPNGETCIGGRPAPCGSTQPDKLGTCGVEACPDGDCVGSAGTDCTCLSGDACVAATGPTGSGECRQADGTCLECKCASPDTPIATPTGERAISELALGDLVYSIDGDQIRAVPILRVNRTPVVNHQVLRVTFDGGRSIEMTAGHPLADGYPLSVLKPGSELLGGTVASVASIPYAHDATYDILPDSTSGAYFASGVLMGSTLNQAGRVSSTDARTLKR
ncbi:MAG TPA: Hint domain-containing protein, partial [Polyangiaceae bacterium]|nr:Hint domain-containing protein [Polyangiaceae bacterium]